jgi:glycogen phosphorylase
MKVLVNGGLNVSELDGWWAEAYSREVGWAIGDGKEHDHDPAWDTAEANELYDLIEKQIAAEFYDRDEHGIPRAWVTRMRESMARLTPAFSTSRVVHEYTEKHYLPAAAAFRERAENQGVRGAELLKWQRELARLFSAVRIGAATMEKANNAYLFQVQVFFGDLNADAVRVELYAEGGNAGTPERHTMQRGERLLGSLNGFLYSLGIPAKRPAADYTPRVVPDHAGAAVPLEAPFICWEDVPAWRAR